MVFFIARKDTVIVEIERKKFRTFIGFTDLKRSKPVFSGVWGKDLQTYFEWFKIQIYLKLF
jgi:hypothetical protein